MSAIRSLRGGRVNRSDRAKGIIDGGTQWSLRSVGETIRYRLNREDEHRTRVELVSHPRFRGTLLDYGINYDNAERLTAALGVKPEQYLLRASRVTDRPEELLKAASGPGDNSADLLWADPRDDASFAYRPSDQGVEQEQSLGA
jgi:hypothetical protein